MAKPYAEVIGDPIAHSKSPLIHGFWLEKLGIDARYERVHVTPESLTEYIGSRRKDADWRGCNVTIPHKQAVIAFLDRVDPGASAMGAVNTICREADGSLTGFNTDAPGFLEPLRPLLKTQHILRMARVIGTGGAARAIVHGLAQEGFVIAIIARDEAKAHALLKEVEPDAPATMVTSLTRWGEHTDFAWDDRSGVLDLVVNATSLGMKGYPLLNVDFSHIPAGAIIYDIVYSPLQTPLLTEAKARGLRTVDGLEMLVGQAAVAFAHFFGISAPRNCDPDLRALLTA